MREASGQSYIERVRRKDGKGRPPVYEPNYHDEAARDYALKGATNADLADVFKVNEYTIDSWIRKHESFNNALKSGREVADSNITKTHYKAAMGCTTKETRTEYEKNANGDWVESKRIVLEKEHPPNQLLLMSWENNRMRKWWAPRRAVSSYEEEDRAAMSIAAESMQGANINQEQPTQKIVTIEVESDLAMPGSVQQPIPDKQPKLK